MIAQGKPCMTNNPLWAALADRRLWRGCGRWTILLLIGANVGIYSWHGDLLRHRQQNLLAPPAAALAQGTSGTRPVRYDWSVGEDTSSYWRHIPDAGRDRLAILCGMSQMFAINEARPGDQTISEWLDDRAAPAGTRVFGLAAPNLSNEEALLLLVAALEDPRVRPHWFIYGVCFDKFRNLGLRCGYQTLLRTRPDLRQKWRSLAGKLSRSCPLAAEKMLESLAELQRSGPTASRSVESRLRQFAADWIPMVAARQELNAYAQMRLFLLRNLVLQITPTSKRPVLPARYALNRQFLEAMAVVARQSNVHLMLYVVPFNPLADNPYVPEQYDAFKRWLEDFARRSQVPCPNLENTVPAGDWGQFMGGPDFKHFKGVAHRRLADALWAAFGDSLEGSPH